MLSGDSEWIRWMEMETRWITRSLLVSNWITRWITYWNTAELREDFQSSLLIANLKIDKFFGDLQDLRLFSRRFSFLMSIHSSNSSHSCWKELGSRTFGVTSWRCPICLISESYKLLESLIQMESCSDWSIHKHWESQFESLGDADIVRQCESLWISLSPSLKTWQISLRIQTNSTTLKPLKLRRSRCKPLRLHLIQMIWGFQKASDWKFQTEGSKLKDSKVRVSNWKFEELNGNRACPI